jgi:hypothetical protein
MSFGRVLLIAQLALLVRRHMNRLSSDERHRLAELARHGTHLTAEERKELRTLVARLEPGAFARTAAGHISPIPLGSRILGKRR